MSVALIIGGSEQVKNEHGRALALCGNLRVTHFLVNDQIALWDATEAEGVTLHPPKLPGWLNTRTAAGLPPLRAVWSIHAAPGVDCVTSEWRGSSGLFAVKVAMECGFRRIVLCGVPMEPGAGHVVRHRSWPEARTFHRGWQSHRALIAPVARSCSGWTQRLLGDVTAEWLRSRD